MCAKRLIRSFLMPAGLKNKGNTCFFNAATQCLLSMPSFINFMKKTEFDSKSQPISYAFKNFIFDYQNASIIDPKPLINVLKNKMSLFNGHQQDSYEYLAFLFSLMFDEQPKNDKELESMFISKGGSYVKCTMCKRENFVSLEYLFLPLQINESVGKSIDTYFSQTNHGTSSDFKCENCNKKTEVDIKYVINDVNDYLMVYLYRFKDTKSKSTKSIVVDEEIVVAGNTLVNIGVVCHSGSLNSGHYYAKALRDKTWYEFNDSSFSKTDRTFDPSTPLLVFYALKNKN